MPENLSSSPPTTNDLTSSAGTQYIDSLDYQKWQDKLKECLSVMDELTVKSSANRKLRYAEVDIEAMRKDGHLAPDELYIPRHIIDSNIRREQSSYIQYVSQSPRAVILQDRTTPTNITSSLEHDVTTRIRFDGWQNSMYSLIDAMQQNGYGVMEVVQDLTQPGELSHEHVQLGDFSFVMDTRNIQEAEMVMRAYYFTKTRLVNESRKEVDPFDAEEVEKLVQNKATVNASTDESLNTKEKSLYKIYKVMFRHGGVVMVAWTATDRCDKWLRDPRPLFLGRRKTMPVVANPMVNLMGQQAPQPSLPQTVEAYETNYPYFIAPYLISENNTISQLKGRVFLDQDSQEAAASLLSSFCTGHRRASGLYFSKDVSDPNDDIMMQKDVFFKTGALINSKVQQFQLKAPDSEMASAISLIETMNQNETSQVNFAVNNRKDSRKTAKEIGTAEAQQNQLTTVQVVLFSSFLKEMFTLFFEIVQSRVTAGLIEDVKNNPELMALYARTYVVKPSGDADVIERQQLVQTMMSAWSVIQNTPANVAFLSDLVSKMFPETGMRYVQIFQQAQQQQQSVQAQQQMQLQQQAANLAQQVVELSKHPEMFSDTGKIHALPAIQGAASQIEQMQAQNKQSQQRPAQG